MRRVLDEFYNTTGHKPVRLRVAPVTANDLHAEIVGRRLYFDGALAIRGVPIERDNTVPPGHIIADGVMPTDPAEWRGVEGMP